MYVTSLEQCRVILLDYIDYIKHYSSDSQQKCLSVHHTFVMWSLMISHNDVTNDFTDEVTYITLPEQRRQ